MTPNVSRFHADVHRAFPEAGDFGQFNCRSIAGSGSWSQHSWSNADDVKTGPYGTAYSSSRELQSRIVRWLMGTVTTNGGSMRRYQYYGIRTLLSWGRSVLTGNRVAGHYDHIHADFWPKGIWTPPCAGGSRRVQYPNGSIGSSFPLYPNLKIVKKEEVIVATYRTVRNVPHDGRGNVAEWVKRVIDWAISARLIIVSDDHPDDWNEVLTSGRYWTFEHRRRNA